MIRILSFHCCDLVQSLIKELRSFKLHGQNEENFFHYFIEKVSLFLERYHFLEKRYLIIKINSIINSFTCYFNKYLIECLLVLSTWIK